MSLADLLSRARDSVEYRRAKHNARADRNLLAALVQLRIEHNFTQTDVAALAGISQQAVSKFERTDGDPKLSTVRRYADAVGALLCHTVDADEGQLNNGGAIHAISFRASAPVHGFLAKPATYPVSASGRTSFALSA